MRYVGVIITALCVPAVLLARWVGFPLSKELSGISFSLIAYERGQMHPTLLSYGTLAAFLLLIALDAIRRDAWKRVYYAGVGLVWSMCVAFLQVAVGEPQLLKDLAEEADWLKAAHRFSVMYLPTNAGVQPNVWTLLPLNSLGDRLLSGWYFMGLGWYVGLLAGGALLAAGARHMDGRARRSGYLVALAGLCVAVGAFLARPLIGEQYLVSALRAQSRGRAGEAVKLYERAFEIDAWNALSLELHVQAGALDAALGRTDSLDFKIYHAEMLIRQDHVLPALLEYDAMAETAPQSVLIRTRDVELWTDYGVLLYQSGAFGDAVEIWQRALKRQPTMWPAAYYLSRGYFAVGRYREATRVAAYCIQHVADPAFKADLYSNLGDSLFRRGASAEAHVQYYKSYTTDSQLNPRALSSATGP